jgi:lycopene cyclase CruA
MSIDPQRYPRTLAAFAAMNAADHLERIIRLDEIWHDIRTTVADDAPSLNYRTAWQSMPRAELMQRSTQAHWHGDLVYAGGGLGLIHAVVMVRRGWRVLVFDRNDVGCVHREWNISRYELQALVDTGFCSWAELAPIIMNEYDDGIVRFHKEDEAEVTLHLPEVLNVALDAGALLLLARQKFLDAGGEIRDQRRFQHVLSSDSGPQQVLVSVQDASGQRESYAARLVIDGMGTISPLSLQRFGGRPFAGVCPTVGTVAEGFVIGDAANEHNPKLGDILLTIADAQRTQQYMWEGFPGRGNELTIYLFYYDTLKPGVPVNARPTPTLLELFEDYFEHLESYKRSDGAVHHHKPVYGYIPARHSLRRLEAPLLRGVVPIGDAAAQQSPLTFCGFGSHVRNLGRTTMLLHEALTLGIDDPNGLRHVTPYQVNVSLNWVFSRFMQPWGDDDDDVNRLQHHFMAILQREGTDFATRFFRDEMRWSDYHKMVLGMFFAYRPIVGIAFRVLKRAGVQQWVADYLRFCWAALIAAKGRTMRRWFGQHTLHRIAADLPPRVRLALLAMLEEWRVMTWDRD